jgi:hypothetical protein
MTWCGVHSCVVSAKHQLLRNRRGSPTTRRRSAMDYRRFTNVLPLENVWAHYRRRERLLRQLSHERWTGCHLYSPFFHKLKFGATGRKRRAWTDESCPTFPTYIFSSSMPSPRHSPFLRLHSATIPCNHLQGPRGPIRRRLPTLSLHSGTPQAMK